MLSFMKLLGIEENIDGRYIDVVYTEVIEKTFLNIISRLKNIGI